MSPCCHPQSPKNGPYSSCTQNKAGKVGRKWIWEIFVRMKQEDLLTKMSEVRQEIYKRIISIPIFRNDLRPLGATWGISWECLTDVSPDHTRCGYRRDPIYRNHLWFIGSCPYLLMQDSSLPQSLAQLFLEASNWHHKWAHKGCSASSCRLPCCFFPAQRVPWCSLLPASFNWECSTLVRAPNVYWEESDHPTCLWYQADGTRNIIAAKVMVFSV